jgi:hypothetical protein
MAHTDRDSATVHVVCPAPFAVLRRILGLDLDRFRYSLSLPLSPLGKPGHSGSSLFCSGDRLLTLKEISSSEAADFSVLLKGYFRHLAANPTSMLLRLLALVRIGGQWVLIMPNLFAVGRPDVTFDLKGSTVDRRALDSASTQKDCDVTRVFAVGSKVRHRMAASLVADVKARFFVAGAWQVLGLSVYICYSFLSSIIAWTTVF